VSTPICVHDDRSKEPILQSDGKPVKCGLKKCVGMARVCMSEFTRLRSIEDLVAQLVHKRSKLMPGFLLLQLEEGELITKLKGLV